MGLTTLAAWTGTPTRAKRLQALPGVQRHQVGDSEATVIFEVNSPAQKQVFRLLKPCQRRWVRSPRVLAALELGRQRLNGT